MNKHTLALCMIVKNEEAFLDQCLESVKGIVDEIVIVDTGSTDRTVEIAEKHHAKIYHHAWQNSFSEARNYALQFVTSEWVLQLDADEVLEREDAALLKKTLAVSDNFTSICVPILNYLPDGVVSKFYYRRFYKKEFAHYEGRVHNQIVVSGEAVIKEIRLYHFGYDLSPEKMAAKHKRTLGLILKQLEDEPNSIFYRFNLVRTLRNMGDYDQAIKEGLAALALPNVQDRVGYYLMLINDTSQSMLLSNRPSEALELCKLALEKDPLNIDILFGMGGSYVALENYEQAIDYYKKWVQAKKQTNGMPVDVAISIDTWSMDGLVYENMGRCYRFLKDYDNAIKNLYTSIELEPARKEAFKALALCFIETQKWTEAIDVLEKAISNNHGDSFLYYKLGMLYQKVGNIQKTLENLEHSVSLDDKNSDVLSTLGQIYLLVKNVEKARFYLQKSLGINGEHIGARITLLQLSLAAKEMESVKKQVDEILALSPQDVNIFSELGEICSTNGLYKSGIKAFEKYLQYKSDNEKVWHNLASCYAQTGNFDSARIGYQTALKINPMYAPSKASLQYLEQITA